MKKIFLYALMLFSGFSCISCSDDEKGMANIDREWMTMFICDNNRGKGDDYAYNCKAEGPNGNDIHLYWYGVNNCAGLPDSSGTTAKCFGWCRCLGYICRKRSFVTRYHCRTGGP